MDRGRIAAFFPCKANVGNGDICMKNFSPAAVFALPLILALNPAMAQGTDDDDEAPPISAALWQGTDIANRSTAVWVGGAYAVNNDLTTHGFMLRADAEYNEYSYFTDDLGKVNGKEWQGDVMLGYQLVYTTFSAGLYLGVDFRDDHLSPRDLSNSVRGNEVGFKVDADFETETELPYYFGADGYYSTAFYSYLARGRVGVKVIEELDANFKQIFVGAEGYALGNEESDAQRAGGFLKFELSNLLVRTASVTLSGGYQFVNGNDNGAGTTSTSTAGGEGGYGMIEFKYLFRP
ncbi:cellulose biosynthesis protein BcsS [Rhodomicrobium vannielii]|uniref:cellulose biosynthesis protein BcsS n=1 Tax=Rhodomicrobium vannielii TaxID=1069 RepID=UPI0031BBC980